MKPICPVEWTVDDIMALPEGERVELIDGVPYAMALPSTVHQRIVRGLALAIGNHISEDKLPCELLSGLGVFLSDDKDLVLPDLIVVCDQAKLHEDGCHGAPDWIIASMTMDYMRKTILYHRNGVRLYWIVDAKTNHIIVYDYEHTHVESCTMEDLIPVSLFPGFSLRPTDYAN